jgi:PAS domain S-box-containing protein
MRQTGIPLIGDVPWGTHFCQFYHERQDLIDILVPYFKAGLQNNEFCMWITSEPLGAQEARSALRREIDNLDEYLTNGQIEILEHSQWYRVGGKFESDRVLAGWVRKLEAARARGFEGLRLTGNTFWLEEADWQSFTEYEAAIDNVIGRYPMLALCTYSLLKCGAAEIMDVVSNHAFAIIKRAGRWQLIESAERKRIEATLQQSKERLDLALEAANAGAWEWDLQTGRNTWSEQMWNLYSVEPHSCEPSYAAWRQVVHPDDRAEAERVINQAARAGTELNVEFRVADRGGATRWLLARGRPVRDTGGEVARYSGIVLDITGRKRTEEELRQREARRLGASQAEAKPEHPQFLVLSTPFGRERPL